MSPTESLQDPSRMLVAGLSSRFLSEQPLRPRFGRRQEPPSGDKGQCVARCPKQERPSNQPGG